MKLNKGIKKSKEPKKKKSNGNHYMWVLVGVGALLFGVVTWVVLSSTRSVTAIVPSQSISAGDTITPNMLKTVQVPANTPSGYITDENSLIGQKVKTQVDTNQLLYNNNVQTSFNMFGNNVQIPKNYVLTNINVPDERAVQGLISAGDSVDLVGVPNGNYASVDQSTMDGYLGGISKNKFGGTGIQGYFVLGNVKVLQSFKSQSEQSNAQANTNSKNGNNAPATNTADSNTGVQQGTYVVALSYADYKKLIIAQQYLTMYLNVEPKSGFSTKLIEEGNGLNELKDSQKQDKSDDKGKEKATDKDK